MVKKRRREVLEEAFKMPKLNEPKTLDELKDQIAVIGEAIEKCEKMLQHVAISNFSGGAEQELDYFMCRHIELLSTKKKLENKLDEMTHHKHL